jgi:hypothetical protein
MFLLFSVYDIAEDDQTYANQSEFNSNGTWYTWRHRCIRLFHVSSILMDIFYITVTRVKPYGVFTLTYWYHILYVCDYVCNIASPLGCWMVTLKCQCANRSAQKVQMVLMCDKHVGLSLKGKLLNATAKRSDCRRSKQQCRTWLKCMCTLVRYASVGDVCDL